MRLTAIRARLRAHRYVPTGSQLVAAAPVRADSGDGPRDAIAVVTTRELVVAPLADDDRAITIPFAHVFRAADQAYMLEVTYVDWAREDFRSIVLDVSREKPRARARLLLRFAESAQVWLLAGHRRDLPQECEGMWWWTAGEAPTPVHVVAWRSVLEVRVADTYMRDRSGWERCEAYHFESGSGTVLLQMRTGFGIACAPESPEAWCAVLAAHGVRDDPGLLLSSWREAGLPVLRPPMSPSGDTSTRPDDAVAG